MMPIEAIVKDSVNMDIICAKCGKRFSSVEAAREHRGHCIETKGDDESNFIHSKDTNLSPEEQERIINNIRRSEAKKNEPKPKSNDTQRIQVTPNSKKEQVIITNKGIEIRHEGKPTAGSTDTIGYVYLNIDCSSSMYGYKLQQAKKGAYNFARDALTKNYLTGLIKFDSLATLIFEPCKDLLLIESRLNSLEVGTTTNMEAAIYLSCNLFQGLSGPKAIVIVTDGMPNSPGDPQSSLKAGEVAKSQNIDIIAIGTDDADQNFLKKIATRSELGIKVSSEKLEQSITSAVKLLSSNRMPEIKK